MSRLGILGFGTMGAAIARGMAAARPDLSMSAYDKSEDRRAEAARLGLEVTSGPELLTEQAEILLVAVKPQDLDGLLAAVAKHVGPRKIISIVGGRGIATFERATGSHEIARLMPNIAATLRESYVGVSYHPAASGELRASALDIARSVGLAAEVPESLLAAVTGVAGSGIAYVLAFVHALAMGGVHAGMRYPDALAAAVQTTRGAVALLSSDPDGGAPATPIDLVTRVCSPAGTTIEGIRALEEGAFAAAVMRAVKAAADRAADLEKGLG